jgi:hypothetical protein
MYNFWESISNWEHHREIWYLRIFR